MYIQIQIEYYVQTSRFQKNRNTSGYSYLSNLFITSQLENPASSSILSYRLKAQRRARSAHNRIPHSTRPEQPILIRHAIQVALRRRILFATKVIIALDGAALIVNAVQRLLDVDKHVALDEDLAGATHVDRVADIVVVVVEDVAGAEAEGWAARVQVRPVVVRVGDFQVARVFVGVAVGVSDQRGFPVVVDVVVAEGDEGGGVGDVEEAVVVVLYSQPVNHAVSKRKNHLIVIHIARQIAMVDPDVHRLRLLDANRIARVGKNLADRQVAHNHVRLPDIQAHALEHGVAVAPQDALVGAHADPLGAGDGSLDDDDPRFVVRRRGRVEGLKVADRHGFAASAAGCSGQVRFTLMRGRERELWCTYPPFSVAKPVSGTSETEAVLAL